MVTKDELRQYRHLKEEVLQLFEEIRELDMMMVVPSVQNLSGMPGAHQTTDKIGEVIARADALRKRYFDNMSILLEQKAKIEAEVDALEADEQMLIRLYYFRGMTWEAVAATMCLSWNALHHRHRKILRKLRGDEIDDDERCRACDVADEQEETPAPMYRTRSRMVDAVLPLQR